MNSFSLYINISYFKCSYTIIKARFTIGKIELKTENVFHMKKTTRKNILFQNNVE